MGVRDKLRRGGTPPRVIPVNLVSSRSEIRRGVIKKTYEPYKINDYGEYIKPETVDYDVLICVSSYNRYEKLLRILEELHTQKTRYSFKIIIMNDGSTDKRYQHLKNKFPELIYLKNKVNGGKNNYWKTMNIILEEVRKYKTNAVIQIDDDFILCKNFINILMDKFFELKEENNSYVGIRYHLGVLDKKTIDDKTFFDSELRFQNVDGGTMFDINFLKLINYKIESVTEFIRYGSGVWNYLDYKIREFGVLIYSFRESLVYHDGNDDSKMHPEVRKIRKYNTINFIDKNE